MSAHFLSLGKPTVASSISTRPAVNIKGNCCSGLRPSFTLVAVCNGQFRGSYMLQQNAGSATESCVPASEAIGVATATDYTVALVADTSGSATDRTGA